MSKIVRVLNLNELALIQPPMMLSGTRLVARGFNVVFGPSGHFKSFYALNQAMQVAQTMPVAYVAAEGSAGFTQRIDAWCEYYKKDKPERLWFLPEELNLLAEDDVNEAIKAIYAKTCGKRLALIVLDTYARCLLGGDENSAKDCGKAIYQCARIQRTFHSAVDIVHHSNRAERGERGSGALRGAADSMIEISSDGEVIKVECSKLKDGEPWPTEKYRFHRVGKSGVLLPADSEDLQAAKLTKVQTKILEFLSLEAFSGCGARVQQIKEALNLPLSTVYNALSALELLFYVKHGNKGDPYTISNFGLEAFSWFSKKGSNLPLASNSFGDIDVP